MELPKSLTGQLYLLAYDAKKERISGGSQLSVVLRAAVLADALVAGALIEEGGKPHVRSQTPSSQLDPVVAEAVAVIAESRPRSWVHWVGKHHGGTRRAVREQLRSAGLVRVEPARILGIIPTERVIVREPHRLRPLLAAVQHALRDTVPLSAVDPHNAALVALAATGGVKAVIDRQRRRRNRDRIKQLTTRAGPEVETLCKALKQYADVAASAVG